jgi:uncharacterized protein YjiS (DUF1127 family)
MAIITDGYRNKFIHTSANVKSGGSFWSVVGAGPSRIATTLLVWHERARQRRQLLALSDRALQDFGKSSADAAGEGDKPFWRA